MPEFGDIYVCRFPFTSGVFSKPRPVLVLFDLEVDVVICRITLEPAYDAMTGICCRWRKLPAMTTSCQALDRSVPRGARLLFRWLRAGVGLPWQLPEAVASPRHLNQRQPEPWRYPAVSSVDSGFRPLADDLRCGKRQHRDQYTKVSVRSKRTCNR